MARKRKKEFFSELFSFDETQKKEGKVVQLDKTESPSDVLRLIAECEKLVVGLENNSTEEAITEVLSNLAKLKMVLLDLFKKRQRKLLDMKRQRKLLDMHWERLRKNNEDYSKKLKEYMEFLKKEDKKNLTKIKE